MIAGTFAGCPVYVREIPSANAQTPAPPFPDSWGELKSGSRERDHPRLDITSSDVNGWNLPVPPTIRSLDAAIPRHWERGLQAGEGRENGARRR
jgi:hypothetical protein